MKVRIEYTIDVSDEDRASINDFLNMNGLATRPEIKSWFCIYGDTMRDTLLELTEARNKAQKGGSE